MNEAGIRRRGWSEAWVVLLLFLAIWLPRVMALDAFVTVDERKWLARSANFYRAVSHGDWANTFQREHPGVTVMWAGTLGFMQLVPEYPAQATGYIGSDEQEIEAWLAANSAVTPLQALTAGRWWIVLGVSLLLTAAWFPLRRLLGVAAATMGLLMIGWMPWAVALARQLHPDGYVSSLIFTSFVFYLGWLWGGRRRRDLIISGVIMGLAWLTKTPAAFLVPIGGVLLALAWRESRRQPMAGGGRSAGRELLTGYVIWGGVAAATFFLLWPATWVDPIGVFGRMAAEMEEYVGGHANPNFFWGQTIDDPGLPFYWVAYWFRATPASLIGLLLAAVAAWRRLGGFATPRWRQTALSLALFSLLFLLFMNIPAKKFDRYLLPAFLTLDLLAAMGWVALAQLVAGQFCSRWGVVMARGAGAAVLVVALGPLHGLLTWLHAPYYLTYFNPLAGGGRAAVETLIIGWGEGLEQVAAWLNQQPGAEKLRAMAWYYDGPLSYYFNGRASGVRSGSPLAWLENDYVVLYVNQIQRQIPSPEFTDFFLAHPPAFTVTAGGIELARAYDMLDLPLPPFSGLATGSAARFGDAIRLLAHEVKAGDEAVTQIAPGDAVETTLYLQALAPMTANYNLLLRLVAGDGSELWRAEGWPWGAPTNQWPVREIRPDGRTLAIPADTPPGLYKLVASIYDPATLEPLPVTPLTGGDAAMPANAWDVALLQIGVQAPAASPLEDIFLFGDHIALHGADWPAQTARGDTARISLQWEGGAPDPRNYTVFIHLVNAAGELAAQQDQMPLNGFAPTHLWTTGLRLEDVHEVTLPEDLPAGRYAIRVGLYDGAGRLPVTQAGARVGDYAELGYMEVTP
jgi:hypothetical protein